MSKSVLKLISDKLDSLNINYQFGEWTTNPVPDPYWIGEYTEPESMEREENGYQEMTVMLTGTSEQFILLEDDKLTIVNEFPIVQMLPNGNGVGIYYAGSLMIPTKDSDLKRMQINLTVKEWMVN